MWTCRLLGIYRTFRYGFKHFITTGHIVLGHDFDYTGEVVNSYWVMECRRCKVRAGVDTGPPREKQND